MFNFCSNLSALYYKDINTIQIAFQHGFKYAMKLNKDEYNKIQKDKELIRETAIKYSNVYIKIVDGMNR